MKSCLFGATNIVKINVEEKNFSSGYGIAFNGAVEWIFNKDSARNALVFGADNNSSSPADNQKNDFLILGKGPTSALRDFFHYICFVRKKH